MGTKTIYVMTVIVIVAVAFGISLSKTVQVIYAHNTFIDEPWNEAIISDPAPGSCTIFTASYGDTVLFGNNEDYINPNTYYWVAPPKGEDYGIIFLGFDNFWPQGGINEEGLAFDVNALPKAALNPHPERPMIKKPFYEFLKKCSTVKEVIDRVNSYSWESSWRAQLHVADRTGDAVVISAGPDGEIAFTRKQKGNGYLISTNFNRANTKNGRYPCWRYDTAVEMLEKIRNEEKLTVDYFRSILDAVHQEGPSVNTLYSNIFDLKNGVIYLYHWNQFYEVAKLNVANELLKAPSPTRIRALFSQETVHKASKKYLAYQKKVTAWKNVLWVWFFLATGSLVVLIWDLAHSTRALWRVRVIWVLVVALFGPVGLMVYLYSYRQPQRSPELKSAATNWRSALGATVFSVVGYAIGITFAFSSFYLILPFNESSLWSVAARLYGMPLLIGLFFSQVQPMAFVMENQYWTVIRRRFLVGVISLNFVLVGMLSVTVILMSLCEMNLGMSGPGSMLFWGVIVLGAFAGALTIYPFNVCMAHRGFCFWPFRFFAGEKIAQENNSMVPISLRNAWGVLLLSFLVLIGSIVLLFSYLL
jgi:predicted choloylglycine hydrolase